MHDNDQFGALATHDLDDSMKKAETTAKAAKAKAGKAETKKRIKPSQLRSRAWFDNPANADMTALYLERTMNFGLSLEEPSQGGR